MKLGHAIPYGVKISPSDNKGFIVRVGCSTHVFATRKALVKALEEYTADPDKWVRKYYKNCGRRRVGFAPRMTTAERENREARRARVLRRARAQGLRP
jgi:hypothetical protein